MLGYITLGTNDLPRTTAFCDALLPEIDAQRAWASAEGVILMAASFVYFI